MGKTAKETQHGQAGSAADFQVLFESVPGMCLVLDPDLRIVAVSDTYLRNSQAARADLAGRCIWEVFPEDSDDPSHGGGMVGLRASLDRVCRDRVPDTMAVQRRSIPGGGSRPDIGPGSAADGRAGSWAGNGAGPAAGGPVPGPGWAEDEYVRPVNIPVLSPGGELRYIIHWAEDITSATMELADAHRARLAAEEARDEFIYRVSHELRTPINTILGFGELLSLGELPGEHRDWATMMLKAARNLATFLDDVLDISRANRRKLSLAIEPVSVRHVIADALELVRPLAISYGVRLDPPPQTRRYVSADPQRLRQVLLNLLSNAIKYNHPAGRASVTVGTGSQGLLRINVIDTGRGIAEYDISQLFVPFQRLDAANAGVEGAGLGLTLCRQLIEAMGGAVGATSTAGEGSIFWVDLPVAKPAAPAPQVVDGESVLTTRAYPAPRTVIYVEDMVEGLRLVEHILRQRPSARVIPAMLGGVALDLAAEHHPDLILLDLNLPDMSGEELLYRFQADPATSGTPIVIISADANADRMERLVAAGAVAYLTKPISVRTFLQTIDGLLAGPAPDAAGPGRVEQAELDAQPAPPPLPD
ncbi:MAG TPA: ATP-binding protein [Streptosporangiaceae bacterium]